MLPSKTEQPGRLWCGLVVGNSRLHWALFSNHQIKQTWDVEPGDLNGQTPVGWPSWANFSPALHEVARTGHQWPPLWLLSVVPHQTLQWQRYPQVTVLELTDIPLPNTYPSLGCDRALAVWAAGQRYGFPILVIDGGTALTLTGASQQGDFFGGAIMPGLLSQMRSLSTATTLPTVQLPDSLPPRWASSTPEAIGSGVLYGTVNGVSGLIEDWCQQFPDSKVVFTGGDGQLLVTQFLALQDSSHHRSQLTPQQWKKQCIYAPMLLFQGIDQLRTQRLNT